MSALTTVCPWCSAANNAHEGATPDDQPTPGDRSVCWTCGHVSVFDRSHGQLGLRRPTALEALENAADEDLQAALAARAKAAGSVDVAVARWRNTRP